MWICHVCDATNSDGLDICPSCGRQRGARAIQDRDALNDTQSPEIAAKRLQKALGKLVAAGLCNPYQIAHGLATGRVTAILKAYSEGEAMERYRAVVRWLAGEGYDVGHYEWLVVSGCEERPLLDEMLNENDNREPPFVANSDEALEPPTDDLPF